MRAGDLLTDQTARCACTASCMHKTAVKTGALALTRRVQVQRPRIAGVARESARWQHSMLIGPVLIGRHGATPSRALFSGSSISRMQDAGMHPLFSRARRKGGALAWLTLHSLSLPFAPSERGGRCHTGMVVISRAFLLLARVYSRLFAQSITIPAAERHQKRGRCPVPSFRSPAAS